MRMCSRKRSERFCLISIVSTQAKRSASGSATSRHQSRPSVETCGLPPHSKVVEVVGINCVHDHLPWKVGLLGSLLCKAGAVLCRNQGVALLALDVETSKRLQAVMIGLDQWSGHHARAGSSLRFLERDPA